MREAPPGWEAPREGVGSLWRKTIFHDGQTAPAKDSRPPGVRPPRMPISGPLTP